MSASKSFWGDLIVSLRHEQKLSQRQLASGAKVNRSTLRRIEDNSTSSDIETMEKLLTYMGHELEAVVATPQDTVLKLRAAEAEEPAVRSRISLHRLLQMGSRLE